MGLPPRRLRDYPHELGRTEAARDFHRDGTPPVSSTSAIADEPTTALDVMVQAQVLQLLKELQRELGLAMLFITHDLSVLVEVCDRLAIMYAGKIVEEGPSVQVFQEPKHPYTRALSGAFPGRRSIATFRMAVRAGRLRRTGNAGGMFLPPLLPGCVRRVPDDRSRAVRRGAGRRAACSLVPQGDRTPVAP